MKTRYSPYSLALFLRFWNWLQFCRLLCLPKTFNQAVKIRGKTCDFLLNLQFFLCNDLPGSVFNIFHTIATFGVFWCFTKTYVH
ncbi:hypothetical protein BGX38DRAFT_1160172 [Terfezia claveryi]|nr:hypothetical protein BGX38DRAFT_1160172 [Terfezia claveryi]